MSNWQYANQVPTKQFRSANSIPRDLDLFVDGNETYCGVTPSKEMLALRGKKNKNLSDACELIVDVKGTMELTLSNTKGELVVMNNDAQKQTFSFCASIINGKPVQEAHKTAVLVSAFVCTQNGAMPVIPDRAFDGEGVHIPKYT